MENNMTFALDVWRKYRNAICYKNRTFGCDFLFFYEKNCL